MYVTVLSLRAVGKQCNDSVLVAICLGVLYSVFFLTCSYLFGCVKFHFFLTLSKLCGWWGTEVIDP